MLKSLKQWFFPHICCLCEHHTTHDLDLCSPCKISLPWITDRCYQCGVPLEAKVSSVYCQQCIESPPKFDRLCALFSYEPPVTQLITKFKFGDQLAYGRILGELLAEAVHQVWYDGRALPEAVLPVPLHVSRLRQRGFNQSLELLGPLKKGGQIPILLNACIRLRKTKPQAQLKQQYRQCNVSNAFGVSKPLPFKHIAIVDDVVTTGSTVNALSEVLKKEGHVTSIDVWCICRV